MKKVFFLISTALIVVMLTTSCGERIKEVKIGDQVWMAENLNVDELRDGSWIFQAKTDEDWQRANRSRIPVWCYYDNDPKNGKKYGKLYNWYAVNDPRGLAPKGWRIASNGDWNRLVDYLGDRRLASIKMKSMSGWAEDGNGTNETGFTALPGGYRTYDGTFYKIDSSGSWWSATDLINFPDAWYWRMHYDESYLYNSYDPYQYGFSVRCLRD
jgi:uncharacterized protein (TIGR02145 family)